jgi:hypothetical protein
MNNKGKLMILMLILSFQFTKAQHYENGIGLRGGLYNGITFKKFIGSDTAIEGILQTRWHGWEVVGLMEHHRDITSINGLWWYYGYGAHLGFYDRKYTSWNVDSQNIMVIGIDGIIGIEMLIPNTPVSLGLDWKPYFNIIGYSSLIGDGGAFSVRYTF